METPNSYVGYFWDKKRVGGTCSVCNTVKEPLWFRQHISKNRALVSTGKTMCENCVDELVFSIRNYKWIKEK